MGVRQRVVGGICDRILRQGFENDVVVVLRDACFVSRGRFSGPVKAIRRELEKRVGIETGPGSVGVVFREVNEDYTSKLCLKCHEVLEPRLGQNHRPIHVVRRCRTTSSVRLCHRDANAC